MPACLIPLEPAPRPLTPVISSTAHQQMNLSTIIWISTPTGNLRPLGYDSHFQVHSLRLWRTKPDRSSSLLFFSHLFVDHKTGFQIIRQSGLMVLGVGV